jgi:hypothetical protein
MKSPDGSGKPSNNPGYGKYAMTELRATRENTVFLTVAAFEDSESQTRVFRKTAEDNGVPVIYCDEGEKWRGFYFHKIEAMHPRLKRIRHQGYRYAFLLDCRDVVLIEPLDRILEKFNDLNAGKVIFNQDVPGKIWPSHHEQLALEIEKAMNTGYARLNAGAIAGGIDALLTIQQHTMTLRQELLESRPRNGFLQRIYPEIGTHHIHDDQHLYQLCLVCHPEWFQIDCKKQLFAILKSYPQNLNEYSDDPGRHDVIGSAAIVHSPWLAWGQEWQDRVFQNQWKRETNHDR